jgi:hypothetical protein
MYKTKIYFLILGYLTIFLCIIAGPATDKQEANEKLALIFSAILFFLLVFLPEY